MKWKAFVTAAALFAAAVLISDDVSAATKVSAHSAIVIDGHSGEILWEKNAEQRSLIASTTKIMTGLLIAEDCSLQEVFCIPDSAVGIEGSSLYLKSGELLTIEELLYGMMLHSGNDAATALAIYHSGSVENFVQKMNHKAAALGLSGTSFANPHGLDSQDHYSTALDLAKLTAYAMNNPVFRKVVSTKTISMSTRSYTNHNKLLWRSVGVIGVKTGYTEAAGRILVSCAQRQGKRLIVVTISAPDDWKDHQSLYDHCFGKFSPRIVLRSGVDSVSVPVGGVKEEFAIAVPQNSVVCLSESDDLFDVRYEVPAFAYLPVVAGEPAGEAVIFRNGTEVDRVPLFWKFSILEDNERGR